MPKLEENEVRLELVKGNGYKGTENELRNLLTESQQPHHISQSAPTKYAFVNFLSPSEPMYSSR